MVVQFKFYLFILIIYQFTNLNECMTKNEKFTLKNKVLEMFDHAYQSYMKYAYPADELMPISCKGRHRSKQQEHSRGDIDDVLGNYTLTLVDTLDTLALLGRLTDFEEAVKNVIATTRFNNDIVISVFEANIRMVGGLIGGHISALYIREKYSRKHFSWYKNELLDLAKELGYKLLPAFDTPSGLPVPRVNLKYGITQELKNSEREKFTCTACAGTLILEFAALSRLTGDPIFEKKARHALDFIWEKRNRVSDLVGTILNVNNGDWINKDATIGAGTDSYYEYLLKAYVLLGDDSYLDRFNRHYDSIMKFMSQQHGSIMQTVHMHQPYRQARNYMDALLAFWPGLQVLKGDLKEAIKMHELLYQIVKKHKFLPEAFLADNSVHWGNHPLRPEFLESTYFLYRATKDPYYLEIGKQIIEHLELYSRVPCGYAAIADVKNVRQDDRIDSFVYAETFKYLYLLFEEPEKLEIDVDEFIFTTEAHLLPISLVNYKPNNKTIIQRKKDETATLPTNEEKSCASLKSLFKNDLIDASRKLRLSVLNRQTQQDHHASQCGKASAGQPSFDFTTTLPVDDSKRLKANEFIAGKTEHIEILKSMGIKIQIMDDGRLQLVHHANDAYTSSDAQNGMLFMNEMLELSKQQNFYLKNDDYKPVSLILIKQKYLHETLQFMAGPAQFGLDLRQNYGLFGLMEISDPFDACIGTSSDLVEGRSNMKIENEDDLKDKIVLSQRGGCMFVDKVRNLERIRAKSVIICDNIENTSFTSSPLFAMSGDGVSNVQIPSVFLFSVESQTLLYHLRQAKKRLIVYLGSNNLNIMEASFYLQLDKLRNYIHYDFKKQCKGRNKTIFKTLRNKHKKQCLKSDYKHFKEFFNYFNADLESMIVEEIVRFDNAGVIQLVIDKKTNSRKLNINLESIIQDTDVKKSNMDDFARHVYDELRKKFELNTNILQLSEYNDYMNMLYNYIRFSLNNLNNKIENLNFTTNDELLLLNLAKNIKASQENED